MPYKLAITVAGAVSLGAYEAGVLYEIIDAISQHNQDPATPPADQVVIDVLTGASAGGMSAALLAQKLLFEKDSLAGPYTNMLYRAWVQDLDLQPLLALKPAEDPTHSILSSDYVDTLSKKYLTQRYSTHVPPTPDPHPATSGVIRLGLALSNLNGVDYTYPVRPDPKGQFTYTEFQDELTAKIDKYADNVDFWEPLRKAAVSCGAFPFAFRVKDLVRSREDYDSPNIVFPLPFETFTYTDGGVFQNQPLGLAKNLVDLEDPQHIDAERRYYLFIAPHVKGSSASNDFNEHNADFKALAGQLVNAVYGQAGFQDWIQAEEINRQIELLDQRAAALQRLLASGEIASDPLAAASGALLPLMFAGRTEGQESLAAAQERLTQQYHEGYDALALAKSESVAKVWVDSILTLETAANLGERDVMTIYGITASAAELAGAELQAFVGFFKQDYRDHDYDVGRIKAQAFLRNLGDAGMRKPDDLPPLLYTPKPFRNPANPIDHSLDGLKMQEVPKDLREAMLARLKDRADDILQEAGLNIIERDAVKLFLIDKQLKKLLAL
ncbi:MAG: patatin-like phospholipase family protein [Acidobacteriota bacterium]|jgi:hypothetical protein